MVDINIKPGRAFVPKQNHKQPYNFSLKESAGPGGVRRFHKYNTYGILDNTFQILDTENMSVTQIIPCLAILLKKSESDIVNIVKKSTVNSLASIHFQLCFKYIIPCFTMLCHQILSLAMDSNFNIVHPCQP